MLTAEEAAQYTLRNVLSGSDAWRHDEICASPASPVIASQEAAAIAWEKVPYSICYIIRRDGAFVDAVIETSYTLPEYGNYSVQSVGEFGFTSEPTGVIYSDPAAIDRVDVSAFIRVENDCLYLDNALALAHFSLYDMAGHLLVEGDAKASRSISLPGKGIYMLKLNEFSGLSHVEKIINR